MLTRILLTLGVNVNREVTNNKVVHGLRTNLEISSFDNIVVARIFSRAIYHTLRLRVREKVYKISV